MSFQGYSAPARYSSPEKLLFWNDPASSARLAAPTFQARVTPKLTYDGSSNDADWVSTIDGVPPLSVTLSSKSAPLKRMFGPKFFIAKPNFRPRHCGSY